MENGMQNNAYTVYALNTKIDSEILQSAAISHQTH